MIQCDKIEDITQWLNEEIRFAENNLNDIIMGDGAKSTKNYTIGLIDGLKRAKLKLETPCHPLVE
jgi:hypothetical protein